MFEIKITEIRDVPGKKGNEWVSMGKQADGSEPRGYSPLIDCVVTEKIERFHQIVDELDMPAVVAVVNNLVKKEAANETLRS